MKRMLRRMREFLSWRIVRIACWAVFLSSALAIVASCFIHVSVYACPRAGSTAWSMKIWFGSMLIEHHKRTMPMQQVHVKASWPWSPSNQMSGLIPRWLGIPRVTQTPWSDVIDVPLLSTLCFGAALILLRRTLEPPKGACRHCHYSLLGLSGPVCPECGSPINNPPA